MQKITIISKENCPECERIKTSMRGKGFDFTEKKMEELPVPKQFEMRNVARRNRQMSMPLMFVSDEFIGTQEFEETYLNN